MPVPGSLVSSRIGSKLCEDADGSKPSRLRFTCWDAGLDFSAVVPDRHERSGVADVVERVGGQDEEVGALAGFQRAAVGGVQQSGAAVGGQDDGLHRRQAGEPRVPTRDARPSLGFAWASLRSRCRTRSTRRRCRAASGFSSPWPRRLCFAGGREHARPYFCILRYRDTSAVPDRRPPSKNSSCITSGCSAKTKKDSSTINVGM